MVVAGRKDFVQLSSEVLERGGVLRFRALGGSMHPFIKNGEILRVKPVESADVDCGDVVFYWTRGRGVVAHRLIRKKRLNGEDIFVMKGDSVPVFDELVRAEQVIGKVIAIERNGRVRELESTPHRVLNRVLALVSPFSRRIYLALWMPRRAVVFVARPCVGLLQGQALFRRFVRRAVGGGIDVRSATDEDESTFGLGLARSADALSAEIGPEARLGGRPGVPGQDVYRFIAVRKHVLIGQLFLVHSHVSAENGGDGPYGGWWIYALTVRARFRGAGVGRRLTELAVAEAKARGALDVRLTVFQADRAARTLYEKVGFEKFFSPELKKELDGAVAHGQKRRIAMIKEGLRSPKIDRVSSSKLGQAEVEDARS
ncbi:MAG: signal peptidase I [Terriglobia bacterium]